MADELSRSDDELEAMLADANKPSTKTNSQVWHVTAESAKGCFQWLVESDGSIVDSPYHLRGYWIGRKVDMNLLLDEVPPTIVVTCQVSGHVDKIRTDKLNVVTTDLTQLSEYAYNEPYTGGLYDLTSR